MIQITTAQAAAAAIVQLDMAISERLIDDPKTLALFEAYNHLFDSLCAGLSGELLQAEHDKLINAKLQMAQTALANLGVMGRPLPDAEAS